MAEIIQLLPDNIANQIAAGEVIQRPASVVKELMENAVDAGATKIELHIKDAGKTLIQVIDDGSGMSEMDARMCFERHATSKLKVAEDLFNLTTKGFRGEAMASIAAIAHVDLETKQEEDSVGTKISIAGSKVTSQEPIARSKGTSISVKNLFFNVPARRNFLKTDNVETKHIVEEFNRIALTHPETSFKFTHNNNVISDLQGAVLRKRIVDLHGSNFNTKLVPVEETTDIVRLSGFVGKPEFARKTRGEQYFFVNNRFFKDHYLHHAVSAAFENLIPSGTHPSYFLYLDVPTKAIDVNIHPTKTEIKFEEDRAIYSIIRSAVKLALGKHNIAPSLDFDKEPQFDLSEEKRRGPVVEPTIQVDPTFNPFRSSSTAPSSGGSSNSGFKPLQPNKADWENFYEVTKEGDLDQAPDEIIPFEEEQQLNLQKRMQLHGKFVLIQVKSGLMMIHLSRAKERVLYDELMEQFMINPISSQQIMFPVEYKMQETEKLEWNNTATSLKRLGFEWEWQGNTLVLSGIPSYIEVDHAMECISNILAKIAYEKVDKGELAHTLIASLAKAASKRGNKTLKDEELEHLINSLFALEDHMYDPSGNKIIDSLPIEELNKRF